MLKNQQIGIPAITSVFTNGRPTIGLLIEDLSGEYQAGVWPGIVAAAKEHNVNIISFNGGSIRARSDKDWDWDTQRNVLYEIARRNEIDGFIISGSVFYISPEEITEFLSRYSDRPIVTLTPVSDDIPSVYVDNRTGMHDLVTHLVENHKYRRFAFVKGPASNSDAEQRFAIFCEVLAEHGINIDPDNVVDGNFTRERGAECAEQLLERKARFDVVVCADDDSALGVIGAFSARGLSVPGDIAVVGFDDAEESRYVTPLLTTVKQPYFELGRTAVNQIVARIEGVDIARKTILDTLLITRQSCGCFDHAYGSMKVTDILGRGGKDFGTFGAETLCAHVETALPAAMNHQELSVLVDAFCCDVTAHHSAVFLQHVERIGSEVARRGDSLAQWNDMLSELWAVCLFSLDRESQAYADDLLHRARMIVGSIQERAEGLQRIYGMRDSDFVQEIGETIANSLQQGALMKAICSELPELGLRTFFVSQFEKGKKSKLLLSVCNGRRITLDEGGTYYPHFISLLPPGTVPGKDPHVLIAELLYFQDEAFGFVVFDVVDRQPPVIYDIIRRYISGALHSIQLVEKTQKQAEELRRNNDELTRLRAVEHAHLQAIRGELELGRKIQKSFLPETIPQPEGYEVAETFMPAREVSGDFYDAYDIDNKLFFVVADVSGKDVSAALFMSLIRTLLRVFAERLIRDGQDPLESVRFVNDYIIQHHRQKDGRCMFATMFYAVMDPATGTISYVNAGHNPPVMRQADGTLRTLPPTGPAVGLAPGMIFKTMTTNLLKGDLLFVYTDGVTEAQDPQGGFFGTPKLHELLLKPVISAKSIIQIITDELTRFQSLADDDRPSDDITMMAIRRP